MKKTIFVVALILIASTSWAWEVWEPSFYVGGGAGYANTDTGISGLTGTASLDEDDYGGKIFGGMKFNKFLGAEVAYNYFGEAELKGNAGDRFNLGGLTYQFLANGTTISAEGSSFDISAIYFIPFDYFTDTTPFKYFEPFVKVGVNFYEVEYEISASTVSSAKDDDDGADVIYGAGLNFNFHENFAVRAEWQRFEMDENGEVDFFTGNFIFRF